MCLVCVCVRNVLCIRSCTVRVKCTKHKQEQPESYKITHRKTNEIAVANYKNDKDYHNLEILLCTKASPIFPD